MFCRSGRSYVVNEPEQIRQPRCDDMAVSSLGRSHEAATAMGDAEPGG
jgi:hypothetical protein